MEVDISDRKLDEGQEHGQLQKPFVPIAGEAGGSFHREVREDDESGEDRDEVDQCEAYGCILEVEGNVEPAGESRHAYAVGLGCIGGLVWCEAHWANTAAQIDPAVAHRSRYGE